MAANNCKFALKCSTKKRPSDDSAESSLGQEELRINLAQSGEILAEAVMSVNKKSAINRINTTVSRPSGIMLTLKLKENRDSDFLNSRVVLEEGVTVPLLVAWVTWAFLPRGSLVLGR